MNTVKSVVLSLLKKGDVVQIVPNEKCPEFPKEITVCDVMKNGILYDVSSTSDGYLYPFWAIEDIRIKNSKKGGKL